MPIDAKGRKTNRTHGGDVRYALTIGNEDVSTSGRYQFDTDGNTINVPVYINEKGQYNRVFIDTNKIATVFGRTFNDYIKREIDKGNLIRIKNRSTQASERAAEIADGYSKNASTNSIPQTSPNVNTASEKNSDPVYMLK